MITEAEAKTKWCPFVRYLATFRNPTTDRLETAGCYNRGAEDSGLHVSRCIASACMAWRQATLTKMLDSGESPGHKDDGWEASAYGFASGKRSWSNARAGFCGLAGVPS